MSNKCYLKNQIGLVSLSSKDLFTYDEYDKYMEVVSYSNEIDKIEQSKNPEDKVRKKELVTKKRQASNELAKMIREHKGFPRKVRLDSVIYHKKGEEIPAGVTWRNLKLSKRIAEFESDMSRAMGLQTNDYTFDKIIVVWGSQKKKPRSGNGNDGLDLLEQIVMDGFTMDLLIDGKIVQKKYRYFTSSAGQLRTDKIQMISEDMWNLIKKRVECGMDWNTINARKGVNVSKLLAYLALECSASIPWPEFDINKIIVIPDFEATVTDRMLYIKPDYTVEDAIKTVLINHCDGAGMYLPDATIIPENVRGKNFMIRSNYVKGLLSPFDYIEFCRVHNVPPVIKDCYGIEHNLVTEDIQILLTESQFKFKKLFNSFDEYKECYKNCGCQFVIAQFDEEWPPDKTMNYQFIQGLTDFTDEELKEFTAYTHERLENLATNKDAMLRTLKADVKSYSKDKVALALYPELLRDGYNRQQLKDTKKKMLLDAKSGTIKCKNKRLYVIPDFYAACERWFLGEEHPKGLLEKDEIVCRPFIKYEKADVLRSPSLYMEHFIARINKDPEVYKWFISDGVVTSVHSLVSRILQ